MRHLAVIPSRYEPERLRALVDIVWREVSTLIVLDNGHESLDLPEQVRVVDSRGCDIYPMWNMAWATALHERFTYLTLLNDDIRILPGTLPILAEKLQKNKQIGVTYPDKYVPLSAGLPKNAKLDVVRNPLPERTLTGFAFTSRVRMFDEPPFDTSYHWWAGDDAFDRKVRMAGYGVARVMGLPIEHESDSEKNDWARRPELRKLAEQDMARWNALNA
jgi:GT2 family glycosyltransferase